MVVHTEYLQSVSRITVQLPLTFSRCKAALENKQCNSPHESRAVYFHHATFNVLIHVYHLHCSGSQYHKPASRYRLYLIK